MDDVLALGRRTGELRSLAARMACFLWDELRLTLKTSVTQVYRTDTGVPFLGFRVSAAGLRVRRATWRRFCRRLRRCEWEYRNGRRTRDDLRQSVGSMLAHIRRAPSLGLRRTLLERNEPVEW